jgi:pantothenate kinase type III
MAAVTPALPAPQLEAQPTMPARSSQAAVDSGVLLGYAGLIERLVSDALRASSGPSRVVVTGGQARRFLALTRLVVEHVPDLVHEGLALLAQDATWSN